ncbi:MAG: hypothetical protein GX081_08860 [Firmicutes bacterium]|nr:hypothetical protein [Bacillota bacterium]
MEKVKCLFLVCLLLLTTTGPALAAAAAANFFIPSVEEKKLEQYKAGQGYTAEIDRYRPQLRIGWLPDGGVTAVYSFQF